MALQQVTESNRNSASAPIDSLRKGRATSGELTLSDTSDGLSVLTLAGWLEKLDKGGAAWGTGNSKRKWAVLKKSHLQWFSSADEGPLNGNLDLRRVDVLRPSEFPGAANHAATGVAAIDLVLKGSDRAWSFAPAAGEADAWHDWLGLVASAVPSRAVSTRGALAAYRDPAVVVTLMRESGSQPSEEMPGGLGRALHKLGACTAPSHVEPVSDSVDEQYRTDQYRTDQDLSLIHISEPTRRS
eukprot:1190682-Prymnesium_polylepis.1